MAWALAAFALVSCGVKEQEDQLNDIESFMKEYPDSARIMLESFSHHPLSHPSLRARHSLLLSEAYELCGREVSSDTLIRKAVMFYRLGLKPSPMLSRSYYCLAKIYENQGDRIKAAETYLKAEVLNADGRKRDPSKESVYERYPDLTQDLIVFYERQNIGRMYYQRESLLLVSLFGVLIIGILLFASLIRQKKEKEHILLALNEIQAEYEDFKNKPIRLEGISKDARIKLGMKLKAINCFLEDPPEELSDVSGTLNHIKDGRKQILETVGLLFALWFPSYVNFLLDKKLSVQEIGYCSLITLGIQTKNLGDVIYKSSYYKISSSIRKKIGLPVNEKKLGTFLREKFSELTS